MDVALPNGVMIRGVPEGTTKEQVMQKAIAAGMATAQDFGVENKPASQQEFSDVPLIEGMEGYEQQQAAIADSYAARAAERPKLSPIDYVKAIPEVGATLATGATTGFFGQVAGAGQQLAREIGSGEFGTQEAVDRIAQRAADVGASSTYSPSSPAALNMLGGLEEASAPLAGLTPLTGELAAISRSAVPALQQARGRISQGASGAVEAVKNEASLIAPAAHSKNLDVVKKIQSGSTENELAPYRLEPKNPEKAKSNRPEDFKIVDDDVAKKALGLGWESGTVQSAKNFDTKTATVAEKMLRVAFAGTKDDTFKANNRPIAEMGNEFALQVANVKRAKKQAGKDIEAAANDLRSESVDVAPVVDKFMGEISDSLGVQIIPTKKGVRVDFRGSDLEGSSPEIRSAQGVIQNLAERMYNTKTPSAYDVHRLKQFIDSQSSYGSTLGGLKGNTDRIVKGLRHDLDEVLDSNFENYRIANEKYSETKTALDNVQELVGKKIDLDGDYSGVALGRLSRRILSNAHSAERVREALLNIDDVAVRHGSEGAGNLSALVKFADTLDKQFGIAADTSVASEIAKGVTQGQSRANLATVIATKAYDKMKGKNNDTVFKSMQEILDRQRKLAIEQQE